MKNVEHKNDDGKRYLIPRAFLGAGSAYLYDVTTGTLLQTFNNPAPAESDFFGNSVSISGDKVLKLAQGPSLRLTNMVKLRKKLKTCLRRQRKKWL